MSLDKFVMRGFTGSVGSSEGRWVASSTPTPQAQPVPTQHHTGNSFVMGGGGLRPKPTGPPSAAAAYSEHDSSRGEAMGAGERYTLDAGKVRDKGTQHDFGQDPGCFEGKCLNEVMNSKGGHQVVVGCVMFGLTLFILIFCLVAFVREGKNEDFYAVPGLSKKVRPMWARDR